MLRQSLLSLVVLVSGGSLARAEHIDELALRLQGISTKLVREFSHNYRGSPHQRHLVADGIAVARLARHVHSLAHHGAACHNREALLADVRQLDELYHHMEITLVEVRARSIRPGCDQRIDRLMSAFHDTLEHIESDLSGLDVLGGDDSDVDVYGERGGRDGYGDRGFEPRTVPADPRPAPGRPSIGFRFRFGS